MTMLDLILDGMTPGELLLGTLAVVLVLLIVALLADRLMAAVQDWLFVRRIRVGRRVFRAHRKAVFMASGRECY